MPVEILKTQSPSTTVLKGKVVTIHRIKEKKTQRRFTRGSKKLDQNPRKCHHRERSDVAFFTGVFVPVYSPQCPCPGGGREGPLPSTLHSNGRGKRKAGEEEG